MSQKDPFDIDWTVEVDGRSWAEEAWERYELTPEKIEMMDGKLFGSEAERLRMLGMLLENCGAEAAVHFGDPDVWRRAVDTLADPAHQFRFMVKTVLRQWDYVENREEARTFYERWTLPGYREGGMQGEREGDAILQDYPETTDWSNWTALSSEIVSTSLNGKEATAIVDRTRTTHWVEAGRYLHSQQSEIWELRWRDVEGWRMAEAYLVSFTPM